MPRNPTIPRTCQQCGKSFLVYPSYLRHNAGLYCSIACSSQSKIRPPEDRFWEKVDTSAGTAACWLWTGGKQTAGYGKIYANGRAMGAHRYSYEIAYGPIKDSSLYVCHTCDTPGCVNPAHLFLGTVQDNNRDALQKGRMNVPHYNGRGENHPSAKHREYYFRGEQNNQSKLTTQDVRVIRQSVREGASMLSLSRRFGVSYHAIRCVVHYITWKHVDPMD